MRERLCECGHCRRCKRRRYQAEYTARLRAGTVRHGQSGGRRICDCGACQTCLHREYVYRWLDKRGMRPRRRNEANLGPDLDEAKLNAYFERVKTRD